MCVVSFIGDHYNDKWKEIDWLKQYQLTPIQPLQPFTLPLTTVIQLPPEVSRLEFEELKKNKYKKW